MKQGIGELFMDNIVNPILLGILLISYKIRNLFSKKGL